MGGRRCGDGGREEGRGYSAFVGRVKFEAENAGHIDVSGRWRDFVFEGHEEEVGEGGADEGRVHAWVRERRRREKGCESEQMPRNLW